MKGSPVEMRDDPGAECPDRDKLPGRLAVPVLHTL